MIIKKLFLKHKINLFFDENFPVEIINSLKKTSIKNSARLLYSSEFGLKKRDDPFYFNFCKSRGFSIVTLDEDFMDDRKYPFSKTPGIIRIVSSKNNIQEIEKLLRVFISFLKNIPLPKIFLGDSKFQISREKCIMRARDALSGEIKTMEIIPNKTTAYDVRKYFNYFT